VFIILQFWDKRFSFLSLGKYRLAHRTGIVESWELRRTWIWSWFCYDSFVFPFFFCQIEGFHKRFQRANSDDFAVIKCQDSLTISFVLCSAFCTLIHQNYDFILKTQVFSRINIDFFASSASAILLIIMPIWHPCGQ